MQKCLKLVALLKVKGKSSPIANTALWCEVFLTLLTVQLRSMGNEQTSRQPYRGCIYQKQTNRQSYGHCILLETNTNKC